MTLPQTLSLALPGYASLYLLGMLLCLGMLVPFRQGRKPKAWARFPFWVCLTLLAVSLLPMISGRPGLAMSSEGLVCAGWDQGVDWDDVEAVETLEDGSRVDLRLAPGGLTPPPFAALDTGSWRWSYWLDGRDGLTVAPGATVSCRPDTLALPAGMDGIALGRVMALLAEANRAQRGKPPPGLDWCEAQGLFTERCLARAADDAAACAAAADPGACRAERLALP